ncbi:HD-GYP domain-containing protein [Paenibacillus protaetiae]|uniref:HD-GYP domain-containing protein n=1 Tax=Paenibacillus protaetiae TaxID=2509456 RepID=A0A4P6EQH5_9BACL|nr:HD-GYP domain-containing protein [Paenibacillus protaetiae]QAY65082.1 HD-GYP domain-containing protein [Paenibacillus protaetiae]
MRVHVTDLVSGDRLSRDTFNQFGLHVLSKGTILNYADISKLQQHQIEYVEIENRSSAATADMPAARTLETIVNPKWLPTVQPLYESAVTSFKNIYDIAKQEGVVNKQEISDAVQPLLDNFQMERDVVSLLLLLNTSDDYTYQHSVQVGMLSYYLASWLGYPKEEALLISKAGYLHDIGKSKISHDILNKPGKLTEEEFDEVKKHTLFGHDLIMQWFGDEPYLAVSAVQHHERIDGSGYPYGLKGEDIHPVAKIISVVDIYSAMISERVYRQKRDLLFVLKELYRMSFNELDPHITQTFIKHMIPNFIGKKAKLETGEIGTIIMTHPIEFFRPLIQVDDQFIDLTVERNYVIQEIYL